MHFGAGFFLCRKRKRKLEFNAVSTSAKTPPLPEFPEEVVVAEEPVIPSSDVEAVPDTPMTQQQSGLGESCHGKDDISTGSGT